MFSRIFDAAAWAAVPFQFWSAVFFVFGSIVGSFLNVCIHRMPRGESIVSPPSHCPHCKYSIPWYLNIPLVTWLYLRGRCRNCGAPISARYFAVELVTALLFLGSWLRFGHRSAALALIFCLFMAGLLVATFIDFEHFIIPDEITIGGMAVGFLCSFLVPSLHGAASVTDSLKQSLLGLAIGAGVIYLILRGFKLLLGRHRLKLPEGARIIFSETDLYFDGQSIPYEEVFYRRSDAIVLSARRLELVDRCYKDVRVRLSPTLLQIGDEKIDPEQVPYMEAETTEVVLPREVMGLGDVKFMGGIGAFLGWKAVFFSLFLSSVIGAIVGGILVLMRRRAMSSRLPYGPYIAMAAVVWIFAGPQLLTAYQHFIIRLAGG